MSDAFNEFGSSEPQAAFPEPPENEPGLVELSYSIDDVIPAGDADSDTSAAEIGDLAGAEFPPEESGPDEQPDDVGPDPLAEANQKIRELLAELDEARQDAARGELSAEALERIAEAEEEVAEAEREYEASKKTASAKKKQWETAVAQLQRVIRSENEQLPLFDRGVKKSSTIPVAAVPAPEPPPVKPAKPAEDESWKQVLISALSTPDGAPLPQGIRDALAEVEILTMGDLSDWTAPKPKGKGKRLTDIPGIGEGKAARIEEAALHFWGQRQVATLERVAEELDQEVAEAVKETEADPEAWRGMPIGVLNLETWQDEILIAKGLTTVGAVSDFQENDTLGSLDERLVDWDEIVMQSIDRLIARGTAPDVPQDASADSASVDAWRKVEVSAMGLSGSHVEALSLGGIHDAQAFAHAVFTDSIDTVPGIDTDQGVAELRSVLDRFRAGLPDTQLWDFEAFVEGLVPPKPVSKSEAKRQAAGNPKRSRKKTETASA